MQLIEVNPIARGITKESLTYFRSQPTKVGDIVFVPLRKRVVPALVTKIENMQDVKARLKASSFVVRKTTTKKSISFLPPQFIKAAQETALYTASTTGAVLHSFIPQSILDGLEKQKSFTNINYAEDTKKSIPGEVLILQAENEERLSRYKNIIRESFARKKSVFITTPSIADAEHLKKEMSRGIEEYVFCLHSGLTKKRVQESWQAAQHEKHAVLIIGTAFFISLFRSDISTYIIEHERSNAYKLSSRPYIDLRIFIENYTRAAQVRLILADFPLRVETIFRYKKNELLDVLPPKMHPVFSSKAVLIDMRKEQTEKKSSFQILSTETKELLKYSIENKEKFFLFTARKGLAPITVCRDCGSTVMSEDNSTPMVLHKTTSGNIFVSHRSGETRSADERCHTCKSWRLEALGIGTQRTYEAVYKEFPKTPIFRIDKDTTKTHKQVLLEIRKFYETDGAILLGTEMVIPYLIKPIENCAIVSIDSLLSIPQWKITERIFSIILTIRGITEKKFLIQTRRSGNEILDDSLSGNIDNFYKRELAIRKEFNYPPFSTLIKISFIGTSLGVIKEGDFLRENFSDLGIHIYPESLQVCRGKHIMHALIRTHKDDWPNEVIVRRLRKLPPQFAITINPEELI